MGDLMDRSNRVFGTLVRFEEAFPQLEDVVLEYVETGNGVYSWNKPTPQNKYVNKVSMKEYGGVIRCSNGLCRQGGYELDRVVYEMLRTGKTVGEGSTICAGSEGSPKLRRVYRKCYNGIEYKITLVPKSNSTI